MRRSLSKYIYILLALLLLLVACSDPEVTDTGVLDDADDEVGVVVDEGEAEIVDETDLDADAFSNFSPTLTEEEILGLNFVTADNQSLGVFSDMLFDRNGTIQYVLMQIDPVFGIGEEVVAIDWADFEPALDGTTLIFNQDITDPDMFTPFDQTILDTPTIGFDATQYGLGLDLSDPVLLSMNDFTEAFFNEPDVLSADGESIADIDDLVIDLTQGAVTYAVMEVGGFLDIGNRTVAVPFDRLVYDVGSDDFFLNIPAAELTTVLTDAPEFGLDPYPAFGEVDVNYYDPYEEYFTGVATVPELDAGMDVDVDVDTDVEIDEEVAEGPAADIMMGGVDNLIGNAVLADNFLDIDFVDSFGDRYGQITNALFLPSGEMEWLIAEIDPEFDLTETTVAIPFDNTQFGQDVTNDVPVFVFDGAVEDLSSFGFDSSLLGDAISYTGADLGFDDTQTYLQLDNFADELFFDTNLVNTAGEDLGEIENMVVNLNEAQVEYAIADVGGFLGIGENAIAIPWNTISYVAPDQAVVLDVAEGALEDAPVFDDSAWSVYGDVETDWDSDIESFWNDVTLGAQEVAEDAEEAAEDVEEAAEDVEAEVSEELSTNIGTDFTDMSLDPNFVNVMMVDDLLDRGLYGATGAIIGTITDVIFNRSGDIEYILIDAADYDYDGLAGSEIDTYALPYADVGSSMDTNQNPLLLFTGEDDDLFDFGYDATMIGDGFVVDPTIFGYTGFSPFLLSASNFVDDFFDTDLDNYAGEDLGDIDGLIADFSQGQILYGLADVGGFLGIGDTQVLIPWERLEYDQSSETFFVNVDEETLEGAPTFDDDFFDDTVYGDLDASWDTDFRTFWGFDY